MTIQKLAELGDMAYGQTNNGNAANNKNFVASWLIGGDGDLVTYINLNFGIAAGIGAAITVARCLVYIGEAAASDSVAAPSAALVASTPNGRKLADFLFQCLSTAAGVFPTPWPIFKWVPAGSVVTVEITPNNTPADIAGCVALLGDGWPLGDPLKRKKAYGFRSGL